MRALEPRFRSGSLLTLARGTALNPILTTCIGAYPKPDFVRLPDWFGGPEGPDTQHPTGGWSEAIRDLGTQREEILDRGCAQVIADQEQAGVDIVTDGELARENYVHYHCRHLQGIDFTALTRVALRNGAYVAKLPTIKAPLRAGAPFLVRDWSRAQAHTERPVKVTLPGPMTIADTTVDAYYSDPVRLGVDLAQALNHEVLALAKAGCRHIQIDEPLFARKPDEALQYGFEHLDRAFHGCPPEVTRTLHMCCGYPDRLDNPDYPKADPGSYSVLADAVESSSITAVSLEDAPDHRDPGPGRRCPQPPGVRRGDSRQDQGRPWSHRWRASRRRSGLWAGSPGPGPGAGQAQASVPGSSGWVLIGCVGRPGQVRRDRLRRRVDCLERGGRDVQARAQR